MTTTLGPTWVGGKQRAAVVFLFFLLVFNIKALFSRPYFYAILFLSVYVSQINTSTKGRDEGKEWGVGLSSSQAVGLLEDWWN